MGLLDSILGGLQANGAQHNTLISEVGNMVNQAGGVSGLQQQFQQKGLGGLISGWVSTGPNPPITGQQLLQVLGQDRVMAIASKAGLSQEQVTAGVSMLLPMVIDHLTPHGTVPPHSPETVNAAVQDLKAKPA